MQWLTVSSPPRRPEVHRVLLATRVLEPAQWGQWLRGDESQAHALTAPPPTARFDLKDALHTDALLEVMGRR